MTAPTYDIPPSERALPMLAAVMAPVTGNSLTVIAPVDPGPAKLESLTALSAEHRRTISIPRPWSACAISASCIFFAGSSCRRLRPATPHLLAVWLRLRRNARGTPRRALARGGARGFTDLRSLRGRRVLRTLEDLSRFFDEHLVTAAATYCGTRDRQRPANQGRRRAANHRRGLPRHGPKARRSRPRIRLQP